MPGQTMSDRRGYKPCNPSEPTPEPENNNEPDINQDTTVDMENQGDSSTTPMLNGGTPRSDVTRRYDVTDDVTPDRGSKVFTSTPRPMSGCHPNCEMRALRLLSNESACSDCEYDQQLGVNGYAQLDAMSYTQSYYKPRGYHGNSCPATWKVVVLVLVVTALVIGGLILGYYIRHTGTTLINFDVL